MKPPRSRQEVELKAERGYSLHRGERAAPVKAKPAALSVRMSVNEAFRAVLWASLGHLQANERGALEGEDPEYLHQMRVALRRLRSAFGVFSPPHARPVTAAAASELKWLAGALAPARDWDVFMTETLPAVGRNFAGNTGLAMLAERCERLRRSAARRARSAVASTRYQRLVLSAAGWLAAEKWLAQMHGKDREALAEPVRRFASPVLERRYRRVRKRGRDLAQLSAAELHRLRIAVKKLRYATDFFEGLFESHKALEMHRQLARLQDILGAMNDAATAASLAARGARGMARKRVPEARTLVLGWSRRRAATLKRELEGAWKAFRNAERFW